MASFIAAGTSYSTSNVPMIPFYIYYSMFGFQRVGDLAWAAGDMRTRGFLIGGTSGTHDAQRRGAAARGRAQPRARLDHPELRQLRPDLRLRTRGHRPGRPEAHAGRQRGRLLLHHHAERELPASGDARGRGGGHPRGMYKLRDVDGRERTRRCRCGCSARARSCARSRRRRKCWPKSISASRSEVWSVTSFTELRREGLDAERWSMLHPEEEPRIPYVDAGARQREGAGHRLDRLHEGDRRRRPALRARRATRCSARTASAAPTTAAGCARSSRSTAITSRSPALKALADDQLLPSRRVAEAITKYGIDPDGPNPARS